MYRVFVKNCVFSQFTATHPQHRGGHLISSEIWVYSHSYWMAIFCTANSSPGEGGRGRKILKNVGKNTIFNEHPVIHQKVIELTYCQLLLILLDKINEKKNNITLLLTVVHDKRSQSNLEGSHCPPPPKKIHVPVSTWIIQRFEVLNEDGKGEVEQEESINCPAMTKKK